MLISLFSIFVTIKIVSCWNQMTSQHALYQVTAFNFYERQFLYQLHIKDKNIFFLNGVTNDAALPMIIVVNECCIEEFELNLQDRYIEYINIDIDHIKYGYNSITALKFNENNQTENIMPNASANFLDWDSILFWVQNKCKKFPALKKIAIGTTFEKREIFILKLSIGGPKPAVFIMGGEQGRDWMPTAIILNFISNLLENPSNNILLKAFDYYFVPVFNPDGYSYSMTNDSFWMKNRKKFHPIKDCGYQRIAVGVNIDQNWFLARATTAVDAECNSVYVGHRFLSEEETKSVSSFLNQISVNLIAFMNLRGFGNLVTVPFAESEQYANNQAILMEMLLFACKRVKQDFKVTFKFSNTASCFCMYRPSQSTDLECKIVMLPTNNFHISVNFSGNSADWVKARLNVPIVYTIYMKQEPFLLPHTSHIGPLTKQFTLMAREILMLGSSFYGPLFNKQPVSYSNNFLIGLIVVFINKISFNI